MIIFDFVSERRAKMTWNIELPFWTYLQCQASGSFQFMLMEPIFENIIYAKN